MMRVLITGINGFVGGHLAAHLLRDSGVTIWGQSRQARLAHRALEERVHMLCGDLALPGVAEGMLSEASPDLVVHLAAQAYVPQSFADPAGTLQANLAGIARLFQALVERKHNPVLLSIGSGEEYGSVRADELPIDEATPLRPESPYGVSKAAQGLLAQQYARSHGLRTIHLRPFNHLGPGQSDRLAATSFAHQLARIEAGLQPPVIAVGNLSAERDISDVRDIVAAYAAVAAHGLPGSVYNVGAGRAVSVQHLLDQLIALSGLRVEVQSDPARFRPIDVPRVVCNALQLRHDTGWQPQIPLEQTLADVLADWRIRVRTASNGNPSSLS